MAAIKEQAGPDRYSILMPLNEFEPLTALALQQNDSLLRDGGGRGNFESPGFRKALGFYVEMFDRGWAPLMSNIQISNVWDEFGRGYFAYYISGPWNIAEFERRLPPERRHDWMTAPLPGPDGPGASIAGGSSLVIFARSQHKAQAWQLIEYLSRPDVQERFRALIGDMPPRRSVWALPALASDRYAQAFRQQLERVKPAPKVPEWEHIADELRLVGELAATRQISVEQAVRELDRRVDAILDKRRWVLARRKKFLSPTPVGQGQGGEGASLTRTPLSDASGTGAGGEGASLTRTPLSHARGTGAGGEGASLTRTPLSHVSGRGAGGEG
jgi:multiple sugar transport system substrate-binding protein